MFWSAGCSLLRAEGFSCSLDVLYRGQGISKWQFLINKIKIKFPTVNFFQPAIRKNAGSRSAFNQCGSATLLGSKNLSRSVICSWDPKPLLGSVIFWSWDHKTSWGVWSSDPGITKPLEECGLLILGSQNLLRECGLLILGSQNLLRSVVSWSWDHKTSRGVWGRMYLGSQSRSAVFWFWDHPRNRRSHSMRGFVILGTEDHTAREVLRSEIFFLFLDHKRFVIPGSYLLFLDHKTSRSV